MLAKSITHNSSDDVATIGLRASWVEQGVVDEHTCREDYFRAGTDGREL